VFLRSGLEEGEPYYPRHSASPQPAPPLRFALFEADRSTFGLLSKPHVSAAPHVGLTMFNLFEVVLLPTRKPEEPEY